MTIVEKKSRIVAIIAESTRDNMQRAFNTSLTPMLESILGVPAGELSEFQAIMDKAMPQIGSAMNEIFSQELIGQLVAPVLDGYSEEQIDQIYQMVSNPMYKNFMGEMTVGMVQSPAYMSGVVQSVRRLKRSSSLYGKSCIRRRPLKSKCTKLLTLCCNPLL